MIGDAGSRDVGDHEEVMASIDGETEPRLVIADVSSDDAWVSVPLPSASLLLDWR